MKSKYDELLSNNPNLKSELTEEEIIAQAQALGMKTKEEYQAVQKTAKDTPEDQKRASPLWLLVIPALVFAWLALKSKFKS